MEGLILKVKNTFFCKEFFKFLIIGVINTFNGTILAMLYGLCMQANVAFVFGYITSLVIAYVLNSKFVFMRSLEWMGLIKFAISYMPNFIIQNLVVLVVYNMLGLPSIIAYGTAAVIGIPITFLCVKLFAFSKRK